MVLLMRVQSIMPIAYKMKTLILHCSALFIRIILGIVDVILIHMDNYADGTCHYVVKEYWGPVYTLYDTFIDLYVSIMIIIIIINHIRSLKSDSLRGNTILYTSVIYYNAIRTVCLTIANFLSAFFVIMDAKLVMLLWPIINIVFVVLIGYDADVMKTIQKLRQKDWQITAAATAHNAFIVGQLPSVSQPNQAMNGSLKKGIQAKFS
ncbi:hypothetical protein BDF20DRAFT_945460 [Mycotypha africana]|uniref:uncharacterized protein n=1 Tax=Mycotypha africana TaxID=64632 RepID=UPI00230115F6|nr:uncharacterized protein BDF20DRAFT_945460 [Mycotypha africana]KAI8973209.1 hypothetical protein BDF20DRAFT_945460 [Mycotypha africana]